MIVYEYVTFLGENRCKIDNFVSKKLVKLCAFTFKLNNMIYNYLGNCYVLDLLRYWGMIKIGPHILINVLFGR